MEKKIPILFCIGAALITSVWNPANSATILSVESAPQIVALRDATVKDGAVSGEVVNNSSYTVRDVELLIRHIWHWKNEFRPGSDTESNAVYYVVKGELAPGGSIPFNYRPSAPLASGPDGAFETTVAISGYTEVIQ